MPCMSPVRTNNTVVKPTSMKFTFRFKGSILPMLVFLLVSQISSSQLSQSDSTRIALTSLLESYQSIDVTQKTDSILPMLEKAWKLQQIGVKEEMRTLLDDIEPHINIEEVDRTAFVFLLIKSRNELFHHEYAKALQDGEYALEHQNLANPDELIYIHSTIATCHYYTLTYI